MRLLTSLILYFALMTRQSLACSAFSVLDEDNHVWVGKSFDYFSGSGRVFVNQRNVKKKSLSQRPFNRLVWTSLYQSITFNQIARDFPFGGMNEKGLVMEILWLDETVFPKANIQDKVVNESQVIQYILDRASNTEEAVSLLEEVKISKIMATVHYLICDKSKDCRVVEFLDGQKRITAMKEAGESIVQNSIYSEDLVRIQSDNGTKRNSSKELSEIFGNPLSGQAKASQMMEKIWSLNQGSFTKWQIAYNTEDLKVYFKRYGDGEDKSSNLKNLSLKNFEPECQQNQQELTFNLDDLGTQGEVKEDMEVFTREFNHSLLSGFDGVPQIVKNYGSFFTMRFHECQNGKKKLLKEDPIEAVKLPAFLRSHQ